MCDIKLILRFCLYLLVSLQNIEPTILQCLYEKKKKSKKKKQKKKGKKKKEKEKKTHLNNSSEATITKKNSTLWKWHGPDNRPCSGKLAGVASSSEHRETPPHQKRAGS
jgi:hypothetical protein